MTVGEIIEAVHEDLGNPTDVDPYNGGNVLDTSSRGYAYYLSLVNRGIAAVASWKDPKTGRLFRYKNSQKTFFVKNEVINGTLTSPSTETTFITTEIGNETYVGRTVRINNETRVCVQYDEVTREAVVNRPFSSVPQLGDAYEILCPWVSLPADRTIVEVLKVSRADSGVELDLGRRGDLFLSTRNIVGEPSRWTRSGNRVVFDASPSSEIWWMLECYVLPDRVVGPLDVPDLPEQFHEGIIIWMESRGFRRMQEMNSKYSMGRDFDEFMRTTKMDEDVRGELDNGVKWTVEV